MYFFGFLELLTLKSLVKTNEKNVTSKYILENFYIRKNDYFLSRYKYNMYLENIFFQSKNIL
jgi:hypothetical protein